MFGWDDEKIWGIECKSISSNTPYFIFTCREFFTCREHYTPTNSLFYLYFYYFILTFFFLSPHFSPPSSIHRDQLKPLPQAATGQSPTPQTPQDWQPTIPNRHRQVTHATNTSRSTTHNPKPPLENHPRHKHLKIGNPTTPNHHRLVTHATNTSRSTTPNRHHKINRGEGRAMENREDDESYGE